jgi:Yersinia/Haemophilus virulence surface antigen
MILKIQMYNRTAKNKGFLQHFRLVGGLELHSIRGVCSGLSKEWLIYYAIDHSDAAFWQQYGSAFASLTPAVRRQGESGGTPILKAIGSVNRSGDQLLWSNRDANELRYLNCSFSNGTAHAMAAKVTGNPNAGKLFDPNIGQFDVGNGHYTTWASLWSDMWEYYGIDSIAIYSVTVAEVGTF